MKSKLILALLPLLCACAPHKYSGLCVLSPAQLQFEGVAVTRIGDALYIKANSGETYLTSLKNCILVEQK